MRELKIWLLYTKNSFQQILANRGAVLLLMSGKIIRVLIFLMFLGLLFSGTKSLAGYKREQIIFFFLAFNLIDTLAQFFFREVYRFRPLVISGNFDFVLLKPINPLIRILTGGADVMDLMMLFLLSVLTGIFVIQNFELNVFNVIIFFVMLANGLLIAAALHILVLSIGVMTTEVDNLIMIYRDMASMLRIPVDLYVEPLRFLLTFILPLGMMITYPSKALLGLLSWQMIVTTTVFGIAGLWLAVRFWDFSVKRYSSASS